MNPKCGSNNRLSFFSIGPQGATIFSRYVAYHILSGDESVFHSKEKLLGHRKYGGTDVFGCNIKKLNDKMPFDEQLDIKSLLLDATPLCFYGAALPEVRRAAWLNGLISGAALRSNQFANQPGNRRLTKQHMHCCADCVCEDENAFGIAYWRVVHQLPGVHHCPVHMCALNGSCRHCGKSQAGAKVWNPPAAACPHCGGTSFVHTEVPKSDAYDSYLELCHKVTCNLAVGIAPHRRLVIYAQALTEFGEFDSSARNFEFIAMILKQWNCSSTSEIQDILGAPFDFDFVRSAIAGEDTMVNPAGHLAILAAINSKLSVHATPNIDTNFECDSNDLTSELSKVVSKGASATLSTAAIEIAVVNGLPEVVVNKLFEGKSNNYICIHHRVSPARMQRLRCELEHSGLLNYDLQIRSEGMKHKRPVLQCQVSDLRLQNCRAQILKAIENGATSRQQVRLTAEGPIKLCRKWDGEWLNKILPVVRHTPRSAIPPEEKKRVYREHLLAYLRDHPDAPRYEVEKEVRAPYRWCYSHDRKWFDVVVPQGRSKKSALKKRDARIPMPSNELRSSAMTHVPMVDFF